MNATATLAHSITKASSKQSYLTARLLADRELVDDCLRGYAYFRWADDVVDVTCHTSAERTAFITRQKRLIEALYRGEQPADLCAEEQMLAELIAHDRKPESGLRSFIQNFMAVIEFDAYRNGRLVTRNEMTLYTNWLANAVMDGIQYFIGNGYPYPKTQERTLAVVGAHIAHMLRDMQEDLSAGYVNIPSEDIQAGCLQLEDVNGEPFRLWVGEQVKRAQSSLKAGKHYIDSLEVLRCKLAGSWYCARFEWYLNAIQQDGYRLRHTYPERQNLAVWTKMAWLGWVVTLRHLTGRIQRIFPHQSPRVSLRSD
jgi:phytoene/squalene synthetase